MRSTSRASAPRSRARRSDTGHRPACTKASRGSGKTWSPAAAGFGSTFIRCCRRHFRTSSGRVALDTFYRAINKVERSLIRTDADEVTYNLHIMLRFDLELEMLEGRLRVKDLPEAWREANAGRPRPPAARRPRRLPAGRPLVFRRHRRRISELHDRQHPQRAVLCRRGRGASRDPARDRAGRVQHAARLAARPTSIGTGASISRPSWSSGQPVGR